MVVMVTRRSVFVAGGKHGVVRNDLGVAPGYWGMKLQNKQELWEDLVRLGPGWMQRLGAPILCFGRFS